ncbi:hypothetical protein QJQ45_006131 [Haematococcus lacustris]|nr:hypothetical protein QJQ45_006131 [Haematococcus lacustris]
MKNSTLFLFALLLLAVVSALIWFQTHQHTLNVAVIHGAMNQDSKAKFLALGVDCQETYEMQARQCLGWCQR